MDVFALYVAGFYGGMISIDLVTYPMLSRWRGWLRCRGLRAWHPVDVGRLWLGIAVVLILPSPSWLGWDWTGTPYPDRSSVGFSRSPTWR